MKEIQKSEQITRIRGLDLVRSIAILSVVIYHLALCVSSLPAFLPKMVLSGWAGVDLFFVLSGFLIAGQSLKIGTSENQWKDIKIFWIKRWFRTFPLYFFLLFFYVVVKPIIFNAPFNGSPLSFLFFVQNYFSQHDFVQTWSLCIEEQFYIVFPLIFYLIPLKKIKSIYWIIPICLSFCLRFMLLRDNPGMVDPDYSYLIRFKTHMHLDGICFGVFLAWTQNQWSEYVKSRGAIFFSLGLIGFLSIAFLSGHTPSGVLGYSSYLLLSLFSGLMIVGCLYLTISDRIYKYIYFISVTSYGAYLWNNVVMRLISKYFDGNIHWVLSSFIYFVLSFLMAYITYKFIELPFMKFRNKVLLKMSN